MAKKGSVLVVDDEEIMRDVLETLLSAEGYRVDLAKTGEEGLDAYTKRPYDVVLLDVSMPGIGGLRALEEFLKLDAEAVVLMITAYATFDTAIAAWEKGAFGCIRKPFQNEHISAQVTAGIKRRRKEEERRSLRQAMSREVDRGVASADGPTLVRCGRRHRNCTGGASAGHMVGTSVCGARIARRDATRTAACAGMVVDMGPNVGHERRP